MPARTVPTTYHVASTIEAAASRSRLKALRATIDGKAVVVMASARVPADGQDERETNSVTFIETTATRWAKLAPAADGQALEYIRQLFGAQPG